MIDISLTLEVLMKKIVFIIILTVRISLFSEDKDPFTGYWMMPNEKFIICIEEINGEYLGYIAWLKDKVYPQVDKMRGIEQIDRNNPDPLLKNRKVIGLKVVGELHKEDDKLNEGWAYDCWNGKKYYGSAAVIDKNTLKVKGALDKFGIFGRSLKAKRVENLDDYNIYGHKTFSKTKNILGMTENPNKEYAKQ